MFGLGAPELIIILVIVLVVFGAGKLPQVLGSLGKGVREFRDASEGRDSTTNPQQIQPSPQPPNPYVNNNPNATYSNPQYPTPDPRTAVDANAPGLVPGPTPTNPLFDAAPSTSGQPNTYVTPPAAQPAPTQAPPPGDSTQPRS